MLGGHKKGPATSVSDEGRLMLYFKDEASGCILKHRRVYVASICLGQASLTGITTICAHGLVTPQYNLLITSLGI